MLRTDKPIYKVILVLNLLFIVVGIVTCVPSFKDTQDVFSLIGLAMTVLDLIFAGFYIINGYRKDAAKYYKIYGLLLAVKYTIIVVHSIILGSLPFEIFNALTLVIVLVLTLSSNLGKNKSFILCGLLVILRVICFVIRIALIQATNINSILSHMANIDLVCLYGIMTYAKYLDKTERGTK